MHTIVIESDGCQRVDFIIQQDCVVISGYVRYQEKAMTVSFTFFKLDINVDTDVYNYIYTVDAPTVSEIVKGQMHGFF